MRRSILSAAGGSALVASSFLMLPAESATPPTHVDGNHFAASGLKYVSQGCLDPGATPDTAPKFRVAKGPKTPPIGDRSIGWKPAVSGFGAGALTHVDSPSALTVLGTSVYAPDGHTSGQAVVEYPSPDQAGVWKGRSGLGADASTGWHAVNAATRSFQWRHFTDGVADQDAGNATIASFVAAHGGDGTGAWVGFAYGCDGNPFYLDALRAETNTQSKTYDFEGFATSTKFENDKKTPKKITIIAGKRLPLTAELRKRFDGTGMAGQLKIESRKLSEKKWGTVAKPKVGSSGNYDFKVRPFVSSALKLSYAGTTAYEASSRLLTILVRPYVTGGFVNSTVTKGHAFTLRGRILPARHAAITLQRWAGTHWMSVKKGSTGADGRYSIGAVSTKVGRSYWRITVAPGGGNIAGKSPWQKLKTVAPPTGGGSTPPPPPPSDDPPPPPQDDPPPPPPPTH